MIEGSRTDPSKQSLGQAIAVEVNGVFGGLAHRVLGDSPGVQAFATGLFWVCVGLALQVLGSSCGILAPEVILTRFFVMVATLYVAVVGLVLLCGVMTILAGAIRYGVGATDR